MDDDNERIVLDVGDKVTVEYDRYLEMPVIRIQNTAFVEQPRWLTCAVSGEHDRARSIDALIWALQDLKDYATRQDVAALEVPRTCPKCGGACTVPGEGPHGQIGGLCTVCGWDFLTDVRSGDRE